VFVRFRPVTGQTGPVSRNRRPAVRGDRSDNETLAPPCPRRSVAPQQPRTPAGAPPLAQDRPRARLPRSEPRLRRNSTRTPPRRPAPFAAHAASSSPEARLEPRWITPAAKATADPSTGRIDPRNASLGQVRRVPKPRRHGNWFPGELHRRLRSRAS